MQRFLLPICALAILATGCGTTGGGTFTSGTTSDRESSLRRLGVAPTEHPKGSASTRFVNRLEFTGVAADSSAIACADGTSALVGGVADVYLLDDVVATKYAIAKVGPDARVEEGFGNSGAIQVEVGSNEARSGVRDLVVDDDGVTAGGSAFNDLSGVGAGVVVRHAVDNGAPVSSWGPEGFARLGNFSAVTALAAGDDGATWVAGTHGDRGVPVLLRLDAEGKLDTAFGKGGLARLAPMESPSDMVVAPDGAVLVVGARPTAESGDLNMDVPVLARVDAQGRVDTALSRQLVGKITRNAIAASPTSIAIDSKGRIVVAGAYGVARLLPDGRRDTDFGAGGVVDLSRDTKPDGEVQALAVAEDDTILVTGGAGDHFQNGVGHAAWVLFDADGRRVADWSDDGLEKVFAEALVSCGDRWFAAAGNGEGDGLHVVAIPG